MYTDVIQQYKLRYNEALGIYKVLTSETGKNYDPYMYALLYIM